MKSYLRSLYSMFRQQINVIDVSNLQTNSNLFAAKQISLHPTITSFTESGKYMNVNASKCHTQSSSFTLYISYVAD